MAEIELRYGVSFGKGDGSDWIEFEYELAEAQAAVYYLAVKMR